MTDTPPILVGVSTCLLGEKVRWDAGHKHNDYVHEMLGGYFQFVPVCPELEVGMGVPREPVHLIGDPDVAAHGRQQERGRLDRTHARLVPARVSKNSRPWACPATSSSAARRVAAWSACR